MSSYIVTSRLVVEADSAEEASALAQEMWRQYDPDEIMDNFKTNADVLDLHDAVSFYGDPESYWAIFITPDRPAGLFADDVGCVELDSEHDHRHGRRARQALGNEWWGTEPCDAMKEQIAKDSKRESEGVE